VEERAASRAARVLWLGLLILALARAALAFVPSMWGWGLDLLRFLPAAGWALWAAAGLALVPALARPLAPGLARAGDALAEARAVAVVPLAVAAAALVWWLADQTHFVGDFMLRLGAASGGIPPARAFPQAFPLDLLLHFHLPVALHAAAAIDVGVVERLLGAAEAGALALLAVAYARALDLRGAPAAAAVAVALCGGYLGMFTGYSKAFGEVLLVTAAVAVLDVSLARRGRGHLALGVVLAVGLTIHRSVALLLFPAATAWWVWGRSLSRPADWRRPAVVAGLALPLVTLAAMTPRIATALRQVDRAHLLPAGGGAGGALAAALAPLHLLDLANVVAALSPLALAALPLGAWVAPGLRGRPEAPVMAALAAPCVAILLLVHPRQGVFRDWDVFTAAGLTLSLVAAWLVGESLRAAPRWRWLAAAVALGAAAPTVQGLLLQHDVDRGMARVTAHVDGPPARPAESRALAWAYLGIRSLALARPDAAAEAMRRAAELAPSPRLLLEWGITEAERGNDRGAREAYQRSIAKDSTIADAWIGLAVASYRLGALAEARRAAERGLRLRPGDSEARSVLAALAARERTDGTP